MAATSAVVGGLLLLPTSQGRGQAGPTPSAAPAGLVAAAPPAAGGVPATSIVNGASVPTVYGPVQVQITVTASRIVSVRALEYPNASGRDQEINSYAIPVLKQETVSAQNAQIDTVSGATYTSTGYVQSLQAALDAAHLEKLAP